MQVKDVMTAAVVDVQPETWLYDAVSLMLAQRVSGLPVVDRDGRLVGVLSEGDLLRRVELGTAKADHWYAHVFEPGGTAAAYAATHTRRVGDVMSRNPVTATRDMPLADAVALMERHRVKRLPVLDDGQLVGIVSRSDFMRALAPIIAPAYEEPATSDAEIERTIRSELAGQDWAASTGITVAVMDGRVALRGAIIADAQRKAARVLAENVNGVRSVDDGLVQSDAMPILTA